RKDPRAAPALPGAVLVFVRPQILGAAVGAVVRDHPLGGLTHWSASSGARITQWANAAHLTPEPGLLALGEGQPTAQVDLEALHHLAVGSRDQLALEADVGDLGAGAGVR